MTSRSSLLVVVAAAVLAGLAAWYGPSLVEKIVEVVRQRVVEPELDSARRERTKARMHELEGEVRRQSLMTGELPQRLDVDARDAWDRPLCYRVVAADVFELQSAGADACFDTEDDLLWPPR